MTGSVTTQPGFLNRREMLDRYESKTGRRMTDFAFYEAFAIPPDSFARAVAFAISQPEDVDVNEILFRPTRQEL